MDSLGKHISEPTCFNSLLATPIYADSPAAPAIHYISREVAVAAEASRPSMCVCVCLSVSLSLAAFPHYCTDPDVRGFPIVVHHWADLQSVHGFRC